MLTFLLRELDEILWVWPILENHSWEKCTPQQKTLEFWCDDVMLNSLEVHRNWNFVSLWRWLSMNLCSRGERDEWKREKNGLFFPIFWPSWPYAANTDGEDQWASFLSFSHPFWIDLTLLALQSLASVLLWFNLEYLPSIHLLIFNFSNPNNYNESYSKTKLLYSNCIRWPSVP